MVIGFDRLFLRFERSHYLANADKGKHLNLMVWQFNQDAAKFYKKLGMMEQRVIYWKNILE